MLQGPRIIPNHFSCFAKVEGNTIIFDFNSCLVFIGEKGIELFGKHFQLKNEDQELIYKLLIYTIRDEENAQKHKLNLQKGIMLTGPVGCGKTSLMKLIRFFQPQQEVFMLKSCREISFEFIAKGFEVIHKYSSRAPDSTPQKAICFDDLGTEQNLKYFGNECNVMAEILLSRYDQFIAHGILTHLTTNLSATEIETCYGNRVRSRMREMLNVLSFNKESKDKRT